MARGASRRFFGVWSVLLASSALLLPLIGAAQQPLAVQVEASGRINLVEGTDTLATLELSAHVPAWVHLPQNKATATVTRLPVGAGKVFTGAMSVPDVEGGLISYKETVKPIEKGLAASYQVSINKEMKLNGLQVSLVLPAAAFAGKEVRVLPAEGEGKAVPLPKEPAEKFQLWQGKTAKVEIASGTDDAISIEAGQASDVIVQDLRKWGPTFEVRFYFVMDNEGKTVPADTAYALDLNITFARPLRAEGL